jgi:hypothetical protein
MTLPSPHQDGLNALANGDLAHAISCFREALPNPQAHRDLVVALLATPVRAADEFKRCLSGPPVDGLWALGHLLGVACNLPQDASTPWLALGLAAQSDEPREALRLATEAAAGLELYRAALAPILLQALKQLKIRQVRAGAWPPIGIDATQWQVHSGAESGGLGRASTLSHLFVNLAVRGQVLTREGLFEESWEEPYRGATSNNRLFVAIRRLRQRLPESVSLLARPSGGYEIEGGRSVWLFDGTAADEVITWEETLRTLSRSIDDDDARNAWCLVVQRCAEQPELAGALCWLAGPDFFVVGRGPALAEDSHPRIWPARQRPGLLAFAPCGPLTNPQLSRRQLQVRATEAGIEILNVGRAKMRVSDAVVAHSILGDGDAIEIAGMRWLARKRAASMPDSSVKPPSFGEADARGIVGETPGVWSFRNAWDEAATAGSVCLVGQSARAAAKAYVEAAGGRYLSLDGTARAVASDLARIEGPTVFVDLKSCPAELVEQVCEVLQTRSDCLALSDTQPDGPFASLQPVWAPTGDPLTA